MLRGSLRHNVSIYRPDTYTRGNEIDSWKLVGTVKASISVKESYESVGGDFQGIEIIEITLPYSKALDLQYADMILVHRGREFEVIAPPTNVGYMDKVLKILAKSSDNAVPNITVIT
jgi:hypothetical protein